MQANYTAYNERNCIRLKANNCSIAKGQKNIKFVQSIHVQWKIKQYHFVISLFQMTLIYVLSPKHGLVVLLTEHGSANTFQLITKWNVSQEGVAVAEKLFTKTPYKWTWSHPVRIIIFTVWIYHCNVVIGAHCVDFAIINRTPDCIKNGLKVTFFWNKNGLNFKSNMPQQESQ